MENQRGMTIEEERAIEAIAGHLYDTTLGYRRLNARNLFIEGFKAGRLYTINQFEDFTNQFERDED